MFYRVLPPISPNKAPKPPVKAYFVVVNTSPIRIDVSGTRKTMLKVINTANDKNVSIETVMNVHLNAGDSTLVVGI
jgi:hypothetical protein